MKRRRLLSLLGAMLLGGAVLSACTIAESTNYTVNLDAAGVEAILHNGDSSSLEAVPVAFCGVPQVQGPSNPGSSQLWTYWYDHLSVSQYELYGLCTQQKVNALYTVFTGAHYAQANAAFNDIWTSVVDGNAWFYGAFVPGMEEQPGAGWVPGAGCYVFQMGPLGNYEYWTTAQHGGPC